MSSSFTALTDPTARAVSAGPVLVMADASRGRMLEVSRWPAVRSVLQNIY